MVEAKALSFVCSALQDIGCGDTSARYSWHLQDKNSASGSNTYGQVVRYKGAFFVSDFLRIKAKVNAARI